MVEKFATKLEEQVSTAAPQIKSLVDSWQRRYGINLSSVSREAANVMGAALQHGTTPAVRKALFKVLAEQSPAKAAKLEMDAYAKKGVEISDPVKKKVQSITDKKFEKPEEGLAAYREAAALLKAEAARQQPKAVEAPKARQQAKVSEEKGPEKHVEGEALVASRQMLGRVKEFEAHVEQLHKAPLLANFGLEGRIVSSPAKAAVVVLRGEGTSEVAHGIDAAMTSSDREAARIMSAVYQRAVNAATVAGDRETLQYLKGKQQQLADNLFSKLTAKHGEVVDEYLKAPKAVEFFTTLTDKANFNKGNAGAFFSILTSPETAGFDESSAKAVHEVFDSLKGRFPELATAGTMDERAKGELYGRIYDYAVHNKEKLPETFQFAAREASSISEIMAVTDTVNRISRQAGNTGQAMARLETEATKRKV